MNIILLVTIIAVLFAAVGLLDRVDAKRRVNRAPLGADLRHDRDAARVRTEIDANVDHLGTDSAGSAGTTHRHAA